MPVAVTETNWYAGVMPGDFLVLWLSFMSLK